MSSCGGAGTGIAPIDFRRRAGQGPGTGAPGAWTPHLGGVIGQQTVTVNGYLEYFAW